MAVAIDKVNKLKVELNGILSRYGVPLDDRSFVTEKVEETVAGILDEERNAFGTQIEGVRKQIDLERTSVTTEVEKIKNIARDGLTEAEAQARRSYDAGFAQGQLEQAPSSGLSTFQILIGVAIVTIGMIIAAHKLAKD
jgi:hypothetical protein